MAVISIITVSYNAVGTVDDCIQSIQKQKIGVEHVVIDGQSTDGTLKVFEKYRGDIAQLVSEPDEGIYDAMNKGIGLATGEIIGILNADDFYPSTEILSIVVKAFDDPSIDACYGDIIYVDAINLGRVVRYWKSGAFKLSNFFQGWMPPHPSFFVRRSVYDKYGLFNLKLGSAADYEIMLRFLLKQKIKVKYVPKTLVHMRTGGVSNNSLRNRLKANNMDRKAWDVNGLTPYPWTLTMKPLRKIGQWISSKKVVL